MAQVNVLNVKGEVVSTLELQDKVFAQEWNDQIMYDVVKAQTAAMRHGSSQTKNRAAVSGGGKKPYRQKGTGHARQGTIRAPQYRGGGHVFELHPRDYSFDVNKKVRRQALRIALSEKLRNGKFLVLDSFEVESAKTKNVVEVFNNVKAEGSVMVALHELNLNVELSARNIPYAFVTLDSHVSVYDVLNFETLVVTSEVAKYFEEALNA
ncbi:MAG: 50S ribosomal protein L4 [Gammaproteobacteria bacterium]|nr:50S ribosomal protein L4 [Gammaproteobacteria bacterium]